jgi:transposase
LYYRLVTSRKTVHDSEICDEFWNKIIPLLPFPKPKRKLGRPRKDDRKTMSGIFYLLITGCQWKALPRFYRAPSTVHDDFRNGKDQAYLRAYGWPVLLSMIHKKD